MWLVYIYIFFLSLSQMNFFFKIQRQALRDISMMCQGMSREAVQKVTCEVCKFLLLDDINYVTASHSAIVCLYQIDPMGVYNNTLCLLIS